MRETLMLFSMAHAIFCGVSIYQLVKSFFKSDRTKDDIAMWFVFIFYSGSMAYLLHESWLIINILMPVKR